MIPALLFVIFIIVIYFTIKPLLSKNIEIYEEGNDLKDLSNKRRLVNIFKQIRETEYEYDMGIISEEDFNRTNKELKLEASILLENKEDEFSQDSKNSKINLEENDKFWF
ncbi:MAG: hypothetical protein CMF96_09880 [Candidatus Marinimicrobia bacterium]|nr:hypothetical protein [Candidatus Neomarinimicrobiota bacterium]|tara:strand:+ start:95 stop:424 length:330 start_codon:yes stop_codon:yes gene_type:complete